MRTLLLLMMLGACSFPRATDTLVCETNDQCDDDRICTNGFCVVGEAQPDGPTDATAFDCTQWTPAPQHFAPCDIPQPTGPLELTMGAYTYHTDTGVLNDPTGGASTPTNQPSATGMLISVDSFMIATGSSLRVVGPVPLIVASWTTIDVLGDIDAGSTALEVGAGANPVTECALHAATPGGANGGGGGGGGGASFQGIGGNGGDGDGGQNGTGGAAIAAPLLLGGCRGADGGAGQVPGGPGGAGGGAFQLTAQGAITIGGQLSAGGAGGSAGQTNDQGGGGGGGGSGGMIGLEGASIAINTAAVLAANGGGGGEGGDNDPAQAGSDATASATRAPGGNQNTGGNGGLGSGGAILTGGLGGPDNGAGGGGGGGGGAAGFITFKSAAAATQGTIVVISPPETVVP